MTTLEPSEFITRQFSCGMTTDNSILSPFLTVSTAQAARERFLAQHGPAAEPPRGPVTSREVRKALVAAEMAHWEHL